MRHMQCSDPLDSWTKTFTSTSHRPNQFRGFLLLFVFVALTICAGPTPSKANAELADSIRKTAYSTLDSSVLAGSRECTSVLVGTDTIFCIGERLLSFSPEDRAKLIGERLERILGDLSRNIDSIRATEAETSTDITLGDLIVMTITDKDASTAGLTRQELAKEYVSKIRSTLSQRREESSVRSFLLGATYALIATVILVLLLYAFGRLFRALYRKIETWKETRIPSLRIQNLELLTAERLSIIFAKVAQFIRLVVTVVVLYFYIPLVLGFFQTSLDDFYVSYEINAYADNPHSMAKTYSDLHQNIQDKFNEAGVEIMSPHNKALRDGNQSTIPSEARASEDSAGSFAYRLKENVPSERTNEIFHSTNSDTAGA